MTQYLLTVVQPAGDEVPSPEVLEPIMRDLAALKDEMRSAGVWVFAGGLHPPSTAVTVDHTGDDLALEDGPYTQAPEYLGGLWVIEAPDREAAVDWAAKASKALGARIEVRAFQEIPA